MLIYPAIDLRGGRVVRLTQGDYDRMTVYGDDPVAVAQGFVQADVYKRQGRHPCICRRAKAH